MINDISYKHGRKFSGGIPAQPATFSSMRNPPISSVYGVNYDRLSLVFSLAVRTAIDRYCELGTYPCAILYAPVTLFEKSQNLHQR